MAACQHGFSNAAFCAMCNAPKGRVYTREASASAAHKGRRNARHKKHRRPTTLADAAKMELKSVGDMNDTAKVDCH